MPRIKTRNGDTKGRGTTYKFVVSDTDGQDQVSKESDKAGRYLGNLKGRIYKQETWGRREI